MLHRDLRSPRVALAGRWVGSLAGLAAPRPGASIRLGLQFYFAVRGGCRQAALIRGSDLAGCLWRAIVWKNSITYYIAMFSSVLFMIVVDGRVMHAYVYVLTGC